MEKIPEWIDLQDQVRDHIKKHDLFNWDEALTDEEMGLLENLLLTFAPIFYPGSVGFKESVEPYLKEKDKALSDANKEIERLRKIEAALTKLVELKFHKEQFGETPYYLSGKWTAWETAKELVPYKTNL